MANKQINAYTATSLADTDSLIKQSVTGLTARTTLADIKGNLDARYQGIGAVVWEDTPATSIDLDLPNGRVYEFWLQTHISMQYNEGNVQIVRCNKGTNQGTLAVFTSFDGSSPDTLSLIQISETGIVSTAPIVKIIDLGEPV